MTPEKRTLFSYVVLSIADIIFIIISSFLPLPSAVVERRRHWLSSNGLIMRPFDTLLDGMLIAIDEKTGQTFS